VLRALGQGVQLHRGPRAGWREPVRVRGGPHELAQRLVKREEGVLLPTRLQGDPGAVARRRRVPDNNNNHAVSSHPGPPEVSGRRARGRPSEVDRHLRSRLVRWRRVRLGWRCWQRKHRDRRQRRERLHGLCVRGFGLHRPVCDPGGRQSPAGGVRQAGSVRQVHQGGRGQRYNDDYDGFGHFHNLDHDQQ